jgi:hypothetical protein
MRFERFPRVCSWLLVAAVLIVTNCALFAQETTGGVQGTVKDASGAVVAGAHVVVKSPALAGDKSADSESTGYYRFANLPPGIYSVEVTAKGFKVTKRDGLNLEVGHLPTVDITLEVGTAAEVVEVSGQAPVIDVTTNTSQTNLTNLDLQDQPHGYSFQSVIQYAPMARNEPLAGGTGMNAGTGGAPPGSTNSGQSAGYMIGGAADSESSYLVEGQDTENISMGYSNANVPFDFIQEVQVKTSGIEAEHGGALGGVVNVVMKKGSNAFHGSVFGTYEGSALDGGPTPTIRYDPFNLTNTGLDNTTQTYQPKQDHLRQAQPGVDVGGAIVKDRLWFFVGLAPFYQSTSRYVNYNPAICANPVYGCGNPSVGNEFFNLDQQQYFGNIRLDATLTSRIRVFASWLTQNERSTGQLPFGTGLANVPISNGGDPIASQQSYILNTAILAPTPIHGIGYVAPNSTFNFGGDITITPKIVSTTRFGYYFNNYHDFGYPTSGVDTIWGGNGTGQLGNDGNPLPGGLQAGAGTATIASYDGNFTLFDANKHYQFDEDVAFFKSGWGGTHNFKFGYQYNRMSNVISQNGNVPNTTLYFNTGGTFGAAGNGYTPFTSTGGTVCEALIAEWGDCAGQYGYATIVDFATVLVKPAIDNNHALFAQDSWTVGHGLTLNLGIRVEKESLPVPAGVIPAGLKPPNAINFSWSDKVEPRLGAAWGSANGKIKIFGSYGVVNDVMKLLVAQSSFGAQAYETCVYPLGSDGTSTGFQTSDVTTTFVNDRACPNGTTTTQANFAGGSTPPIFTDGGTGTQLIENYNLRPWEPVAPGVKPYRQHEFVAGVDYQLTHDLAFEARYDRKRLDHVIEDASLWDPTWTEMYTIVNPGEGVNKTINGYANFLNSIGAAFGNPIQIFNQNGAFGTCTGCPNNPTAIRDYDGAEFRLTKTSSKGWAGMFSYTYSRLWGNYTGLTTTDQIDGGVTGRASPNTTRAFDEPFYYFNYQGKSNAGLLPTDRPNAFKGNAYYAMPWKGMTTTFGLFQVAYQGSPVSTAMEVGGPYSGYTSPFEDTYIFGHGQWANISQDPSTGAVTFGNPYTRRTPWFTQSDFNFVHSIKVNKNNERQVFDFQATLLNLLNQRNVVSYWETANSYWSGNYSGVVPNGVTIRGNGAAFYQAAETGYNIQSGLSGVSAGQFILGSNYGTPNLWQQARKIRLGVRYTF